MYFNTSAGKRQDPRRTFICSQTSCTPPFRELRSAVQNFSQKTEKLLDTSRFFFIIRYAFHRAPEKDCAERFFGKRSHGEANLPFATAKGSQRSLQKSSRKRLRSKIFREEEPWRSEFALTACGKGSEAKFAKKAPEKDCEARFFGKRSGNGAHLPFATAKGSKRSLPRR